MLEGAKTRDERVAIGQRRIRNILTAHVVAPMRTLEQKISDAGPGGQRVAVPQGRTAFIPQWAFDPKPWALRLRRNSPRAGFAGIEAKNIREWLYPQREEIRDLLRQAIHVDAVPVLIGRRIHYSTFTVLRHCGLLLHQGYNQLFPTADADLARLAADKRLLGYHDVRVGNQPDPRLRRFLLDQLPALLPAAREAFRKNLDLVAAYSFKDMPYPEFAARVIRRARAQPEDLGPFDPDDLL